MGWDGTGPGPGGHAPYSYFVLTPPPSQNHLPLFLKQHFRNELQEGNLRNFSLGQTSLDKLRDGLVGAQVPEGHT